MESLRRAAYEGKVERFKWLLMNTDPEERQWLLNVRWLGTAMLSYALAGIRGDATTNRLRIIEVLLSMGAELSSDPGSTAPLWVASLKRMPRLVKLLVSHRAVDPADLRKAVSDVRWPVLVPTVEYGDFETPT